MANAPRRPARVRRSRCGRLWPRRHHRVSGGERPRNRKLVPNAQLAGLYQRCVMEVACPGARGLGLTLASQVTAGAATPTRTRFPDLPRMSPSVRTFLSQALCLRLTWTLLPVLKNFGGSWERAGTAYCGLEAKVTTSDGRTALLYIADGFDPAWIREPGSIDVITGSVSRHRGSEPAPSLTHSTPSFPSSSDD